MRISKNRSKILMEKSKRRKNDRKRMGPLGRKRWGIYPAGRLTINENVWAKVPAPGASRIWMFMWTWGYIPEKSGRKND